MTCSQISGVLEKIYKFKEVSYLTEEITQHLEDCPVCSKESADLALYFEKVENISEADFYPKQLLPEITDIIHSYADGNEEIALTIGSVNLSKGKQSKGGTERVVKVSKLPFPVAPGSSEALKKITGVDEERQSSFRKTIAQKANEIGTKVNQKGKIIQWSKVIVPLVILIFAGVYSYFYILNQETGPWKVNLIYGGYAIEGEGYETTSISVDHTIKTAGNTEVELRAFGLAKITVASNSSITIESTWRDYAQISLQRGIVSVTTYPSGKDFSLTSGENEIVLNNSDVSVERGIMGNVKVESLRGLVRFTKKKNYWIPHGYKAETDGGVMSAVPFFRGATPTFIDAVKEFNNGNTKEETVDKIISNSTNKDIFTLLQCIPLTSGDNRMKLYSKVISYATQPEEVGLKTSLTLTDDDIEIWIKKTNSTRKSTY